MCAELVFNITFENKGCNTCLFLNSSDTGEDCNILREDIQEDEWSNIDYQYGENWRYAGCPLLNKENLSANAPILRVGKFKELIF